MTTRHDEPDKKISEARHTTLMSWAIQNGPREWHSSLGSRLAAIRRSRVVDPSRNRFKYLDCIRLIYPLVGAIKLAQPLHTSQVNRALLRVGTLSQ